MRRSFCCFAMRMAAMFVFTTSSIARSAGVLPRWFIYLGYLVGLFLLLSATFSPLLVLIFPVWLLTLCALLLWRARALPAETGTFLFSLDQRTETTGS